MALSLPEREEIFVALTENPDATWASIARRTDHQPATVAREVTKHGGRTAYAAAAADRTATQCRQHPRERFAMVSTEHRERITRELRLGPLPRSDLG